MPTYTPSQAASQLEAIGISPSTIRNYCSDPRLREFLSAEATPGKGKTRRLDDADLRLLHFIHVHSEKRESIDEIVVRLRNGELKEFQPEPPQAAADNASTALALPSVFANAMSGLQGQLEKSAEREQDLSRALAFLSNDLGKLQGQMKEKEAQLAAKDAEIVRLEAVLRDKSELEMVRQEVERLRGELGKRRGLLARLFGSGS